MKTFKVGDVTIGCNYATLPDRNGMECEIVAPLQLVTAFECRSGAYTTKLRYGVRWADGLESLAQPHTLRKKSVRAGRCQIAERLMRECIERAMGSARERQAPHAAGQRARERCKD